MAGHGSLGSSGAVGLVTVGTFGMAGVPEARAPDPALSPLVESAVAPVPDGAAAGLLGRNTKYEISSSVRINTAFSTRMSPSGIELFLTDASATGFDSTGAAGEGVAARSIISVYMPPLDTGVARTEPSGESALPTPPPGNTGADIAGGSGMPRGEAPTGELDGAGKPGPSPDAGGAGRSGSARTASRGDGGGEAPIGDAPNGDGLPGSPPIRDCAGGGSADRVGGKAGMIGDGVGKGA